MSLRLFTSNLLEILAAQLADVVGTPLASPFDKEILVVQSRGMERWVSMELARHNGICANCLFLFPNAFLEDIFRRVLKDTQERSVFDPDVMTWRIMQILPSLMHAPAFEGLRAYIDDMTGNLKYFQLSERIAATFDQYLLFRPDMIFRWETGEERHWQAILWRELTAEGGTVHRAARGKALLEAIRGGSGTIDALPERVSVFGVSALPRFHLDVLHAISRFCEVNLFLMNPCREYWGDICSDWEMRKKKAGADHTVSVPEELYLERGNSLLASMGTLGRDFFDSVNDYEHEEIPLFVEPKGSSLLSAIQRDILTLFDGQGLPGNRRVIARDDHSVQIHSCHSPMREVEVLHDRLLDMFERDPDLLPKDIVVMTPDIEKYAPYIQAVFDVSPDDPQRIPFSIADRSVRKESEIINTFMSILDLHGSRFGVTQVLSVLESTAVQRKFDITGTEIQRIEKWAGDTRIRWGIDGESRRDLGLPPFEENTWKAGLDRLLLGYAFPRQDDRMFGDIFPYGNIEGDETLLLGRFLEVTEQLFSHVSSLAGSRTLEEWSHGLASLCDDVFMPSEDEEHEMQVIRQSLGDLIKIGEMAGFTGTIDCALMRWYLARCLEGRGLGFGFMTGAVTFCAMLPMRSIPSKVICCIGMDGDAYPRQSPHLGFDLIARNPQPGDRSRRNDDRYLFLEVILSARDTILISFVGQSVQDNAVLPPSVMVSELLDYIEEGFEVPSMNIRDLVMTSHRLQAFNPHYFIPHRSDEPSKLFSYSQGNLRVAECLLGPRKRPEPFVSRRLSEPGDECKTVDVNDLSRFFINPARYFITERLGMYLEEGETVPEDREWFDLTGLERYTLEEELVRRRVEGQDLRDFLDAVKAQGRLPHGTVGECVYMRSCEGVNRFVEKTEPYLRGNHLEPLEVDCEIAGMRVMGRIDNIYEDHLVRYRYARVGPRDFLRLWIHHLLLNSTAGVEYPRCTILVALAPRPAKGDWRAWTYVPVDNAGEIVGRLLGYYRRGLTHPLHFFPETSWEYIQRIYRKNVSRDDAMKGARRKWKGTDYSRGESDDRYYRLCFDCYDPLDAAFQRLSEDIYGPILEYQRENKQ